MKVKQSEQKEIGRVKLSNTQDIVVSIVDNEKLDIRTWVDMDSYKGFTRKGMRLYLFDGNWEEFRKLIDKIDKVYEEIA